MELTQVLLFSLLTTLSCAEQMVLIEWQANNVPDSGLVDVSFPMSMPNAPHVSGYYFEQAVGFNHVGKPNGGADCLYTGLQPRPDSNGASIVHAVFSSFLIDSTSNDGNCHSGSDANSYGVSCAIEIPATYNTNYELKIAVTGETTYVGTLIDTESGQQWHIGTIEVPTSVSGMTTKYVGFVEYYFTGLGNCTQYPHTEVTFGLPKTSTPGVQLSQTAPYANNDCAGQIPWTYNTLGGGSYQVIINP